MKKTVLTIAIILGLGISSFAQNGGGMFQRGDRTEKTYFGGNNRSGNPMLPNHDLFVDQDANAPLGSGIALLVGLGAAYALNKRRKQD